ncbi:N-terminal Xaa-Pro-Lys N-methyltransferase 2 isoform X1 [Cottoperca gobio]|uniref:N-terminal Xaa-Pro-Lys N-methyltransferase 2 isoform X1 n=1 Tax=Cottoperca gobio TaxID=56716 RepID=A0A6J2PLX7_COTGO|nr:alpha N-terminal protein methyltransferase 1B isoform X1 [Cottoperca gobio]
MEISLEDDNSVSAPNLAYKGAHQAFRDRWKETDETMCRHSMSFHLNHSLRSEFFASYLYLLEKIPVVKLFPVTCEYIKGEKQFYYRAQKFYEDVPASEEGMLGGFVEICNVDLESSRQFLKRFVGPGMAGTHCALDCGSGIGRVTKGVLLPVFEKMEMADMMEHFLLHAHEEYLGDDADRIETYYCYSLQDFTPPKSKYDVIWMQWVACHLTDKDLMNFLFRCKKSLRPNGVIIMKDNMARQGCKLDSIDSSISRHLDIMKYIIAKAGLEVLAVERQEGFPDAIMPVWMIAMK